MSNTVMEAVDLLEEKIALMKEKIYELKGLVGALQKLEAENEELKLKLRMAEQMMREHLMMEDKKEQ